MFVSCVCIHVFVWLIHRWDNGIDLPVLPGVQFPQVDQDAVTFHKRYTEEKLEGLVARKLYPPAIHCSVTYSRPPDYEHPSAEILEVKMTGTNQSQVSFPIKVYSAIGMFRNLVDFNFGKMLKIWHLAELTSEVGHVCVCMYVCICNVVVCSFSLQLFLLLQQALHRLHTLG